MKVSSLHPPGPPDSKLFPVAHFLPHSARSSVSCRRRCFFVEERRFRSNLQDGPHWPIPSPIYLHLSFTAVRIPKRARFHLCRGGRSARRGWASMHCRFGLACARRRKLESTSNSHFKQCFVRLPQISLVKKNGICSEISFSSPPLISQPPAGHDPSTHHTTS